MVSIGGDRFRLRAQDPDGIQIGKHIHRREWVTIVHIENKVGLLVSNVLFSKLSRKLWEISDNNCFKTLQFGMC